MPFVQHQKKLLNHDKNFLKFKHSACNVTLKKILQTFLVLLSHNRYKGESLHIKNIKN